MTEEIQQAGDSLPEGNIKKQIHDIVAILELLYPQFATVYKDIKEVVELVGKTKDVSKLVTNMNMCGKMWVVSQQYGKNDTGRWQESVNNSDSCDRDSTERTTSGEEPTCDVHDKVPVRVFRTDSESRGWQK